MTFQRPTPRQAALYTALALSLAATAWVAGQAQDDIAPAAPATPRPSAARRTPAAPADWPGAPAAGRSAWPAADAHASRAWGDAPPPPVAAAAARPPAAATAEAADEPPPAPFPYQLVGRMTDSRPRVVLHGAQRSLVLGVGDSVDGQWRIEAIEPGGLRVRPLPDGPSQFIAFASS